MRPLPAHLLPHLRELLAHGSAPSPATCAKCRELVEWSLSAEQAVGPGTTVPETGPRAEAATRPAVPAVPLRVVPPTGVERRKIARRHNDAEWAEARRWFEEEGMLEDDIADRLGVKASTVRLRRYTERWHRKVAPPGGTILEDSPPPGVRNIEPAIHRECGKWTARDPCWNCHKPVPEGTTVHAMTRPAKT